MLFSKLVSKLVNKLISKLVSNLLFTDVSNLVDSCKEVIYKLCKQEEISVSHYHDDQYCHDNQSI